jgi:ABC-type transporter Mla subunit MlaD
VFLDQAARLSSDLSDVLEANRPFLRKAVTEGGKSLQVLFDERAQIQPLVTGLRIFFQILGEAGRIPRSDGTTMAAIKFILGEDCPQGRIPTCATPPAAEGSAAGAGDGILDGVGDPLELPAPTTGVQGLIDLITGLLP